MTAPPVGDPPAKARRTGASRRAAARLAAVQALYQIDLAGAPAAAVLREFVDHRLGGRSDTDRELFVDIVEGASERGPALDELTAPLLAEGWTLGRLDRVLRAILRAGAFELEARADIPARVVINEYVDVAHAFFDGKEPSVVNGVLDRLARILRPLDLESRKGEETSDAG